MAGPPEGHAGGAASNGKPPASAGEPGKPLNVADFKVLREGEADILLHGNDVFYNKAQIVNRDLSIAVLRKFAAERAEEQAAAREKRRPKGQPDKEAAAAPSTEQASSTEQAPVQVAQPGDGANKESPPAKGLRVLEALAASGLRALRYAREVEGVASVLALDNDPVAVDACKRNIRLNGSAVANKVQAELADARLYMLGHEKEFDAVDLDPYGSPSIFLDSAVQSVNDGGMLMCTATDMAVLCGNNGEVCHSKYGSYPLRGKYCHEMALRILLASIESHANRYKRHIVPVLSVSVDFYVRVFVRIYTSPNAVKSSPSKLSYLYQCVGCDFFHSQRVGRMSNKNKSVRYMPGSGPTVPPECRHCGKHFNMGGPMWMDPIHDESWVKSILESTRTTKDRYPAFDKVHSLLTAVSEELLDVPLFVSLHSLCATLKCTSPSAALFRSAVANAGHRISGSHACALGLKTDAPFEVIWDIMRCWVKDHPVKPQAADTPGSVILGREPEVQANFTRVVGALSKALAQGVPRFLPNPEEYWGPKPRAGRHLTSKHVSSLGKETVESHNRVRAAPELAKDEGNTRNEGVQKRQKVDADS